MRKYTKGLLSALVSAALLTASIPLQTVNAQIVIDHNSSGVNKGFYYEIVNNDKDSQPEFLLGVVGEYTCSWDNDEYFMAQIGVKFAAPEKYSELGEFKYRYRKSIDLAEFKDAENGYVRSGFRIKNTKGDTFTILDYEDTSDGKSVVEKENYKKTGSFTASEKNEFTGQAAKKIAYTIYSKENEDKTISVICRRDVPFNSKNDDANYKLVSISEKLDAVIDAGFDIGEITGVNYFVEGEHTQGMADVCADYYEIENKPEIVFSDWEDHEAPITLVGTNYGERTGYYYKAARLNKNGKMEVIAPSLFKAEWNTIGFQYLDDGPKLGRGKLYQSGQSYKAVSGSSVDYTMNFSGEGTYLVETFALMEGPEMPEYDLLTELHIVDAMNEMEFPEYKKEMGQFSADGRTYEVYEVPHTLVGTAFTEKTMKYYFVSDEAEENARKGTVTAKHDLAPFMEFLHDKGVILGEPDHIVVQIDGAASKGTAELVKNEVTIPDFIPNDHEFDRETRRIDLDENKKDISVGNTDYLIDGTDMTMKGYKGEKIDCKWELLTSGSPGQDMDESARKFLIGDEMVCNSDYSRGYTDKDSIIIDYDIEMGEVSSTKNDPHWVIGGMINCWDLEGEANADEGEYSFTRILVADKWEGDPTKALGPMYIGYLDPVELGVIESNGVKYDAVKILPKNRTQNDPYIVLMRQKQLEPAAGSDNRYASTIDATDIVKQINDLGYRTFSINDVYFSLVAQRNEGSAVVNSADVRRVASADRVYTAEDVKNLSDFILGKNPNLPYLSNYDLNGDGVWDSFDLCSMRKRVAES